MSNIKHLLFDYKGMNEIDLATIPNNYKSFENQILFNPTTGTNIIFKLKMPVGIDFDLKKFNSDTLIASQKTKNAKISLRLEQLENLGFDINFYKIQSKILQLNLTLIDSLLPKLLAHLVYQKYRYGQSNLKDLLSEIIIQNPFSFDASRSYSFYDYKIKNFLIDIALGMIPEVVWAGKYDANGGIKIIKKNGDLVCCHIYNLHEFRNYLMNNTKLEQPYTSEDVNNLGFAKTDKTKPYEFGWVYEENGELFIKLNFQIRFI